MVQYRSTLRHAICQGQQCFVFNALPMILSLANQTTQGGRTTYTRKKRSTRSKLQYKKRKACHALAPIPKPEETLLSLLLFATSVPYLYVQLVDQQKTTNIKKQNKRYSPVPTPNIVDVRSARSGSPLSLMNSSNLSVPFPIPDCKANGATDSRVLAPVLRSRGTSVDNSTSLLASDACALVCSTSACVKRECITAVESHG